MESHDTSSSGKLDFKVVGERLKQLRANNTQVEWAKMTGVDQGYVSQTETGKTKPSLKYLSRVSAITGCNIHWILTGEGGKYLPLRRQKVKEAAQAYPGNEKLMYAVQQLRQDPDLVKILSVLFRRKLGRRLLKEMATWDDRKIKALMLMIG